MQARALFILLGAACFAAGVAAGEGISVHGTMERINVLHNRMEADLLAEGPSDGWEADAPALMGLYEALEGAYRPYYGGAEADWRGFCRESREVLAEVLRARRAGDGAAAKAAFFRLAEIRERAHDEFNPGFLKRLFRKKRREEK